MVCWKESVPRIGTVSGFGTGMVSAMRRRRPPVVAPRGRGATTGSVLGPLAGSGGPEEERMVLVCYIFGHTFRGFPCRHRPIPA